MVPPCRSVRSTCPLEPSPWTPPLFFPDRVGVPSSVGLEEGYPKDPSGELSGKSGESSCSSRDPGVGHPLTPVSLPESPPPRVGPRGPGFTRLGSGSDSTVPGPEGNRVPTTVSVPVDHPPTKSVQDRGPTGNSHALLSDLRRDLPRNP